MALSSKQRDQESRQVDFIRRIQKAGLQPTPIEEQRLAVADYLAACEALLREIANDSVGYSSNPMDHVKATLEWSEKARALLGPAATEEGG